VAKRSQPLSATELARRVACDPKATATDLGLAALRLGVARAADAPEEVTVHQLSELVAATAQLVETGKVSDNPADEALAAWLADRAPEGLDVDPGPTSADR
jgi:hypothetical protein